MLKQTKLPRITFFIAVMSILATMDSLGFAADKTISRASKPDVQETRSFKAALSSLAFLAGFIPDFSMEYFFNNKLVFGGNFLLYNMGEKNAGTDETCNISLAKPYLRYYTGKQSGFYGGSGLILFDSRCDETTHTWNHNTSRYDSKSETNNSSGIHGMTVEAGYSWRAGRFSFDLGTESTIVEKDKPREDFYENSLFYRRSIRLVFKTGILF